VTREGDERRIMSAPAPTCREVVELVNDYLEGAMSPEDRMRFERHLDECPHCVTYLEQMRLTVGVLGRLREDALPPAVRDELVRLFADWPRAGA
jgi:anti-sigma factor RsiW